MKKNSKHPVEEKVLYAGSKAPDLVVNNEEDENIIADARLEAALRRAYYKRMQEKQLYEETKKKNIEDGILAKYGPVFKKLSKD